MERRRFAADCDLCAATSASSATVVSRSATSAVSAAAARVMSVPLSSCACSSSRSTDSAVAAATLVASATASSALENEPSLHFVSSSSMCLEHAAMMSSRSLSSEASASIFTLCSTLRFSTVRKFRTWFSSTPSAAVKSSTRFSL